MYYHSHTAMLSQNISNTTFYNLKLLFIHTLYPFDAGNCSIFCSDDRFETSEGLMLSYRWICFALCLTVWERFKEDVSLEDLYVDLDLVNLGDFGLFSIVNWLGESSVKFSFSWIRFCFLFSVFSFLLLLIR